MYVAVRHHVAGRDKSDFLEGVSPSSAIISVARKNVYRHPSKEVLERLDSLGIRHYGTHEKGSIKVEFSKEGYRLL